MLAAAGVGLSLAGALSDGDGALPPRRRAGRWCWSSRPSWPGRWWPAPPPGCSATPVARLRGMTGALARENAMRNPRRTAATASALMVGVAVVTLFTVFAASLKASIDDTIDRSFAGDLVVSTRPVRRGRHQPRRWPAEVAALPEVDTAVGIGQGSARVDGSTKQLSIADPAALAEVLDVDVTAGALADVGDGLDGRVDARPPSRTTGRSATRCRSPSPTAQTEDLTVAAIYDSEDTAQTIGGYLVPRTVWAPHAVQDVDTMVLVDRGRRRVGGGRQGGGRPTWPTGSAAPTSRTATSSRPR